MIDEVQRQARETHKHEMDALEMRLKHEYIGEINRGRDTIHELQKLTTNVEAALQKEQLKYFFQRLLFISTTGRRHHPRLVDFLYGRTMTDLVAFKNDHFQL